MRSTQVYQPGQLTKVKIERRKQAFEWTLVSRGSYDSSRATERKLEARNVNRLYWDADKPDKFKLALCVQRVIEGLSIFSWEARMVSDGHVWLFINRWPLLCWLVILPSPPKSVRAEEHHRGEPCVWMIGLPPKLIQEWQHANQCKWFLLNRRIW